MMKQTHATSHDVTKHEDPLVEMGKSEADKENQVGKHGLACVMCCCCFDVMLT